MSATSRFPAASWAPMQAPSLDDFEAMADVAFKALPPAFLKMCGDVIIRIEDFPDDEVIDAMELETPFDILGLRGIAISKTHAVMLAKLGGFDLAHFEHRRLQDQAVGFFK